MRKKSKVISTVAVDNDVVRLPAGPKGTIVTVINNDENDLKIIGVETTVLKKGRRKTFKL